MEFILKRNRLRSQKTIAWVTQHMTQRLGVTMTMQTTAMRMMPLMEALTRKTLHQQVVPSTLVSLMALLKMAPQSSLWTIFRDSSEVQDRSIAREATHRKSAGQVSLSIQLNLYLVETGRHSLGMLPILHPSRQADETNRVRNMASSLCRTNCRQSLTHLSCRASHSSL